MSDVTADKFDAPLGAGRIIGDSFSILFGNIVKVMILGFVPALVGLVFSGLVSGWGVALGTAEPGEFSGASGLGFVITLIAQMALYAIAVALLVQLAYDAKQGRSQPLGRYFRPALRAAVPVTVLAIVVSILTGIGSLLLIVPGLWVYAVFSVVTPAVVIDQAGFRGLGRSASLTRGYRWPIVGVLVLVILCTIALSFIGTFLAGVLLGIAGGVGGVVSVLVMAVISGFTYGLTGISVSLIYARLREIKEGVGIDALASVFD